MATDQPLTRLTVNLSQPAFDAMNHTAEVLGDTRTDAVNRALLVYARLCDAAEGEAFTFERRPAHEDVPADTRTVVVFDAIPTGRWKWRALTYWPTVLGAFIGGLGTASLIWWGAS